MSIFVFCESPFKCLAHVAAAKVWKIQKSKIKNSMKTCSGTADLMAGTWGRGTYSLAQIQTLWKEKYTLN